MSLTLTTASLISKSCWHSFISRSYVSPCSSSIRRYNDSHNRITSGQRTDRCMSVMIGTRPRKYDMPFGNLLPSNGPQKAFWRVNPCLTVFRQPIQVKGFDFGGEVFLPFSISPIRFILQSFHRFLHDEELQFSPPFRRQLELPACLGARFEMSND